MIRERLNRIRKISEDLLYKFPDKFADSFDLNKEALNEMATITSKNLRNELAGYICRKVKISKQLTEESSDGKE